MSAVSSTNAFLVSGLASGIDTERVISGMLALQQRQIDLLRSKQNRATQEQSAFKAVEAKLLSLQGTLAQLGRAQNGVFESRTANSNNKDLVTAAASAAATPGVYTLRVNNLARAHQVASEGFDSPNSTITQGTFQIGLGAASTTITIDGTNNTLKGLADAINAANTGVSASIVSDGRNQPHRLVLTASKTGAANAITIVNNLGADSGGARRPEFGATYIGQAVKDLNFTGTSAVASNTGAGGYTGASNDKFTFTVATGGTVGTDNGIEVAYTNASGSITGTLTLSNTDTDVLKDVANGVQVKFGAGTLIAGQKFSVDTAVPTVQQAADASVTLGTGSGAVTVTNATNTFDSLINGVTLNLQGADPNKEVTITVANDIEKAKKGVTEFVDAYNDVMKLIDETVKFANGKAGILLGNRSVLAIQDQVRRVAVESVGNVSPLMNRLSAVGITTNDQGQLVLNSAKLDDALNGRVTGVGLEDVKKLFALAGKSSNPGIQFVTGSIKTGAPASAVQVDITQAAKQGQITATNALAASTVIDGTNNAFTIKVDGTTSTTITLTQGTYTRQALAQQMQTQINNNSALNGKQIAVSLDGDKLKVTSSTYGSTSEVAIGTGTALGALGFAGTESARGIDVIGSFIVDGKVEAATGSGQFLVGTSGNANTADLQVRVTLTPDQVVAGVEGNVTVSRGIASKFDQVLNGMLDPVNGRLKTISNTFQQNIDNLKKAIDKQNKTFETKRESLVRQFIAMETAISKLKSTGDFLGAQARSLPAR